MPEFGFPAKLIALTRMCMEGRKYQTRADQTAFEGFRVITGLRQGYTPSRKLGNDHEIFTVEGLVFEKLDQSK